MADDLNVVSMESDEPDEILQAVERVKLQLLPKKSRNQYDIAYNRFLQWCKVKKVVNNYTENVMLAYFEEKAKIWASMNMLLHYFHCFIISRPCYTVLLFHGLVILIVVL